MYTYNSYSGLGYIGFTRSPTVICSICHELLFASDPTFVNRSWQQLPPEIIQYVFSLSALYRHALSYLRFHNFPPHPDTCTQTTPINLAR